MLAFHQCGFSSGSEDSIPVPKVKIKTYIMKLYKIAEIGIISVYSF